MTSQQHSQLSTCRFYILFCGQFLLQRCQQRVKEHCLTRWYARAYDLISLRKRIQKTNTIFCHPNVVWVRDEGMEIKRQITGMMRLLSDKGSRAYQRVGAEPDSLTREPQDRHVTWTQQPASQSVGLEEHQSNSWNPAGDLGCSSSTLSTPVCNGPGSNQYSTSSRTSTVLSKNTTDPVEETDTNGKTPFILRNTEKLSSVV